MILAQEVSELWKWPNFLLLAGSLGYLIRKYGGPLLEDRSRQIREGLEAGDKARAEAAARAAEVQAKIAGLDREVAALQVGAGADLEREADRIRREAEAEMTRIERHTEVEIVACGKRAQLELRQFAGRLAMDLAERKVRTRMSPDVQDGLLENFAGDLSRCSGGTGGSGASRHA